MAELELPPREEQERARRQLVQHRIAATIVATAHNLFLAQAVKALEMSREVRLELLPRLVGECFDIAIDHTRLAFEHEELVQLAAKDMAAKIPPAELDLGVPAWRPD